MIYTYLYGVLMDIYYTYSRIYFFESTKNVFRFFIMNMLNYILECNDRPY